MTYQLQTDPARRRIHVATAIAQIAATHAVAARPDAEQGQWSEKSAGQVVSEADLSVETLIREELAQAFPNEPILGEEFGGSPSESFWAIDPIDGSANYVNGLPFWGVAIGWVQGGMPELGVIALPDLNLIFAGSSAGFFRNGHRAKPRRRGVPAVSLNLRSIAPRPEDALLLDGFRAAEISICHWRCSAASLAFVADGRLSAHLDPRTTIWDAAPGAALCRAAGVDVRWGYGPDALWIKAGRTDDLERANRIWPDPAGLGRWT